MNSISQQNQFVPPKGLVQNLRKRGFKVRVLHHRWTTSEFEGYALRHVTKQSRPAFIIDVRGGLTQVQLRFPDGREITGRESRRPVYGKPPFCGISEQKRRRLGRVRHGVRLAREGERRRVLGRRG